MPSVATIRQYLERFAPLEFAADWDNVGLLLGDPQREVERVLTCLTVTESVVDEAVSGNVQLIVSHHPILFRGTKRLTADSGEGRLLWPLIRNEIAVYSPHTAFDNTAGGINDWIAEQLGLTNVQPLRRREGRPQFKVVVFVPEQDLTAVSDAMFEAGAGHIGEYRECSFRLAGTGTFFGSDATNPTVGEKGRREEVSEWRLEVITPSSALERVLRAMRQAHSYEEPAFDVYPLHAPAAGGEGRVGQLAQPITLSKLSKTVKRKLAAGALQVVGEGNGQVKRIALACGAAGEFLDDALRARADVFLTGEMRFHDLLKAQQRRIAAIVAGHYPTERPAVEALAERLRLEFPGLEVWASRQEADPVRWV